MVLISIQNFFFVQHVSHEQTFTDYMKSTLLTREVKSANDLPDDSFSLQVPKVPVGDFVFIKAHNIHGSESRGDRNVDTAFPLQKATQETSDATG